MAHIRYEVDRGTGWQLRHEGNLTGVPVDLATDTVIIDLPRYCCQYPHRVFIDGKLIAAVLKPRYLKSKVVRL